MKTAYAALAAAFLALAPLALAQEEHQHHGSASAAAASDEVTQAFKAANEKMHEGMDVALTGNADVDFMRGVIPHHQGAIDMANAALKYGKDPEVRKLAEAVIKAQQEEISVMTAWLAKHGK